MKSNEFQCAHCRGVFEKGWSDEEAEREAAEIFGKVVPEWNGGAVVICDDCFQTIHPLKPENIGKLLNARNAI